MRGRLIVLHIGKIPQIEECGARYVHHLVVVYAQSLVARSLPPIDLSDGL